MNTGYVALVVIHYYMRNIPCLPDCGSVAFCFCTIEANIFVFLQGFMIRGNMKSSALDQMFVI